MTNHSIIFREGGKIFNKAGGVKELIQILTSKDENKASKA